MDGHTTQSKLQRRTWRYFYITKMKRATNCDKHLHIIIHLHPPTAHTASSLANSETNTHAHQHDSPSSLISFFFRIKAKTPESLRPHKLSPKTQRKKANPPHTGTHNNRAAALRSNVRQTTETKGHLRTLVFTMMFGVDDRKEKRNNKVSQNN